MTFFSGTQKNFCQCIENQNGSSGLFRTPLASIVCTKNHCNPSKYLTLWSTERRRSYRFAMAWEWVQDDRILFSSELSLWCHIASAHEYEECKTFQALVSLRWMQLEPQGHLSCEPPLISLFSASPSSRMQTQRGRTPTGHFLLGANIIFSDAAGLVHLLAASSCVHNGQSLGAVQCWKQRIKIPGNKKERSLYWRTERLK